MSKGSPLSCGILNVIWNEYGYKRRVTPTILLLFLTVLGAGLATRSMDAQAPGRVVAPFTVVDKTGRELFSVQDANGRPTVRAGLVAMGTGASGGGFVVVQRANNNDALALGQRDGSFALRVFDITGNTELATVGEAKVGGGVLVANDAAGKTRMLMSGTGQLHAVDPGGVTRATMTADGAFTIRNAAGTTVARLGQAQAGSGIFQLANSGGDAVVEAGLLQTGAGIVRTYPAGMVGGIGVPGTFIMGFLGSTRKSSPSCVMGFVRSSGVTGMKQAVEGRSLPRYRPGPQDWLKFAYFVIAVFLVGFLGLFAFGLVFNEVTIFGWLFVAGFFTFRHGSSSTGTGLR